MLNTNLSPDELTRITFLRALEWLHWPAFLMQPLIPVLYVFVAPGWVLLAAVALNVVWVPFRYRLLSFEAAMWGCYFVHLQWLTIPVCCAYFLWQGKWLLAVLTVLTGYIIGLLAGFTRGEVGRVQQVFLAQLVLKAAQPIGPHCPDGHASQSGDSNQPSYASVRVICDEWSYNVGTAISTMQELKELSQYEYAMLPKSFRGERIYKAPPARLIDESWDVVIGAIDGRIYKIAPSLSLSTEPDAESAFARVQSFCTERLGEPTESCNGKLIWDTSDGNVILHRLGALGFYQLNLVVTSSAVRSATTI